MSHTDTGDGRSVVGAFDAKTHLASLLDLVAKGEVITITKYGVPVARLAPVDRSTTRLGREALFAAVDAFRESHPLPEGMTTRDLIDEGRR